MLKEGASAWNEWRVDDDDGRRAVLAAHEEDMRRYHRQIEFMHNDPFFRGLPTGVWVAELPSLPPPPSFRELKLKDIDLSGADLPDLDLRNYWLRGAHLQHASLRRTQLDGADLRMSDLRRANLSEASLINTLLGKASCNRANFSGAVLDGADMRHLSFACGRFMGASMKGAFLSYSSFQGAMLDEANLQGCHAVEVDFRGAKIRGAVFEKADLGKSCFKSVDLSGSNFLSANLANANFGGANLSGATLVDTNVAGADFTGAKIYGISAWDIKHSDLARQQNLRITRDDEPEVTVDKIEVAQFVHLILQNEKIRDVIDTITSKGVLILGRFTKERKAVLNAVRDKLRSLNYVPMLFDFDGPTNRNVTSTVSTLAHIARFVIVDLTDPSSSPYELRLIAPNLPIPIQPIILEGRREFSMFEDLRVYDWVLPIYQYNSLDDLTLNLATNVVGPAEAKFVELQANRRLKS